MSDYPQAHGGAARVPAVPADLLAPLRLVWEHRASHGMGYYSLVARNTVLSWGTSALVCLGRDGTERWRHSGSFADGLAAAGDSIVACVRPVFDPTQHDEGPLSFLRLSLPEGAELLRAPTRFPLGVLADLSAYIGWSLTKLPDGAFETEVGRVEFVEGLHVRWAVRARGQYNQVFEQRLACADGKVLMGRGDVVLALDLRTGREVWSSSVADQGGVRSQKLLPMVCEGVLVVATEKGTAAFETATGRRLWTLPRWGSRAVYGGRVYLVADAYYVHNLHDGRLLLKTDFVGEMERAIKRRPGELVTSLSVSETHAFIGDTSGRLWAFERDTGRAAWQHRPKGTTGYGAAIPVICGNRLYIGSFSMDHERNPPSLYCYEGSAP